MSGNPKDQTEIQKVHNVKNTAEELLECATVNTCVQINYFKREKQSVSHISNSVVCRQKVHINQSDMMMEFIE